MSFLKNIFKPKDGPVSTYEDFWSWFRKHEKPFHKVVKEKGNIREDFFKMLSLKLDELRDGFYYLAGMYDDNTVELVITADSNIKNIVFVEELVKAAPEMKGWKITALKPAMDSKTFSIEMSGNSFNSEKLSFYSNDHSDYPDEIDLTIIHDDLNEDNRSAIIDGVYIYLDNYLGELDFATTIDNLKFAGKGEGEKELISIEKLKDFLKWRQKEFIEKYEGVRHNTEDDSYIVLESTLESGNKLIAVLNEDLLRWDCKSSHPWIMTIEIKYDGNSSNGMPEKETYQLLDEIENEFMAELKDSEGFLNIGRQTADNCREIYFACRDFRKPSKVAYQMQKRYAGKTELTYDIYKDKYWMSFHRFNPAP